MQLTSGRPYVSGGEDEMEEVSPAFANDKLRFLKFTQLFQLCVVIVKRTWLSERIAAAGHEGWLLAARDETRAAAKAVTR